MGRKKVSKKIYVKDLPDIIRNRIINKVIDNLLKEIKLRRDEVYIGTTRSSDTPYYVTVDIISVKEFEAEHSSSNNACESLW